MNKSVIIVAAGSGLRMGSPIPKQFLLLNGIPVLMHTISRFHFPHSPNTAEVQRGMIILTCVGEKAGFSAGVIVKQGEEEASFVLLGRLPVTSEYRQIPISLINRIEGETIHLNVTCAGYPKKRCVRD